MPLIHTDKEYKYEVAFSFMERDKGLAIQLRDLIKTRPTNFIYSDHQVDLVSTDGRDSFRKVFLDDSRIVVILYREDWGTTEMTRIEHDAIKERRWNESAGFIVFINLDRGKPDWYGKPYIRFYIEEYGIHAAASAIDKKICEYGGVLHLETPVDRGLRLKREEDRQFTVRQYLNSELGVRDAYKEVNLMIAHATTTIEKLKESGYIKGSKQATEVNCSFCTRSNGLVLAFNWSRQVTNTTTESRLITYIGDERHENSMEGGVMYHNVQYKFSINEGDDPGWRNESNKDSFLSSTALIDDLYMRFLDAFKQHLSKGIYFPRG